MRCANHQKKSFSCIKLDKENDSLTFGRLDNGSYDDLCNYDKWNYKASFLVCFNERRLALTYIVSKGNIIDGKKNFRPFKRQFND